MGNCLVTKLKSVVDNDSLEELGHFKFKLIEELDGYRVAFRSRNPYTVKGINCGLVVNGSSEINPKTFNYYGIYRIADSDSEGTAYLDINDGWYSLDVLKMHGVKISRTLKNVLENLPNLVVFAAYEMNIEGDLLSFIEYPALTEIYLGYTTGLRNNNVRQFMKALAQTRNSGTSIIMSANNRLQEPAGLQNIPLVFNGSYIDHGATIYFDSNYPDGWYGKNAAGTTYYNANDEVIPAP